MGAHGKLVPASAIRKHFGGVTVPTVARWVAKGLLPRPVSINGRHYFEETTFHLLKKDGIGSYIFDDEGRPVFVGQEK